MYVCLSVCMYVCMYIWRLLDVYLIHNDSIYNCDCECIYVYNMYVYIYIHTQYIYIYIYTHTIYIYTYTYTYVDMTILLDWWVIWSRFLFWVVASIQLSFFAMCTRHLNKRPWDGNCSKLGRFTFHQNACKFRTFTCWPVLGSMNYHDFIVPWLLIAVVFSW